MKNSKYYTNTTSYLISFFISVFISLLYQKRFITVTSNKQKCLLLFEGYWNTFFVINDDACSREWNFQHKSLIEIFQKRVQTLK